MTDDINTDIGTKFIVSKGRVITLTQLEDGLWVDPQGTVWAYQESTASVDDVDRCGIGIFSFDHSNPLNIYCKIHDYAYSSPAYQAFHTRKEADKQLENMVRSAGYPITSKIFYWITRLLGGFFWERDETR